MFKDYSFKNDDIIEVKKEQNKRTEIIYADKMMLPKINNFNVSPDYDQIIKMTEQELSYVENFSISNEFG